MTSTNNCSEEDYVVEQWKIKKLIKDLSNARGNGTSMISLIIPPKDQISRVSKLLNEEYGTASNIKSRVNRLSVLSAITSTIQRLKLYSNVPENGLVIYCGTVINEDNKERKVNIDFEPFKPINTSLYLCDNKFHTEAMKELLEENKTFGFIIMDGSGCLFGTLCGNTQNVLHKFSVELPKKHGRGGQSSVRFARLRVEKRNNYIRKVAENAGKLFISNDILLVSGLVLAGSASFKNELAASEILDYRLKPLIVKLVDVSYGGENGFNQAIELSAEALQDVKFVAEKKVLSNFMNEIALDTGKICYGLNNTIKALEMNAVENLIIWDNLDIKRYEVRSVNPNTGEEEIKVLYQRPEQPIKEFMFKDESSGAALDVISSMSFLEWLADHYKDYSTKMTFITDCSQEGAQFCKGFGGIGGFLRYQLNFEHLETESEDSDF